MEKKKKILHIAVGIIWVLGMVFAMYKLIKWEEKNAIERQKQVEQKKKQTAEKAEAYALTFVDEYIEKLQDRMRKEGISDLQAKYKKCSKEEYGKHWSLDDYGYGDKDEDADYVFYYTVEYYSDSIDSIYAEKTQNGDFKPFITLMDNTAFEADVQETSYGDRQVVRWEQKTIVVYIASQNSMDDLTVKKEPDQTYRYEEYGDDVRIYVNDEKVHEEERKRYNGSSYSNGASGSGSNSNSSGYSNTWKRSDPYDVYDYHDPDEFAEEWAEEFGDGSYEDGYDDAYDYWEEMD